MVRSGVRTSRRRPCESRDPYAVWSWNERCSLPSPLQRAQAINNRSPGFGSTGQRSDAVLQNADALHRLWRNAGFPIAAPAPDCAWLHRGYKNACCMTVSSALAIYFIVWWVVLFAVLPFGVRSQHEEGGGAEGTDPGAPVVHGMARSSSGPRLSPRSSSDRMGRIASALQRRQSCAVSGLSR